MLPPRTLSPPPSPAPLGHDDSLLFRMSPLRLTPRNHCPEGPGKRSWLLQFEVGGQGDAGAGLTRDPEGAVIAHHVLRLGHHRAAEPVATGTRLAAAGVVRVIVETDGAVGTLNVRVFIPRVTVSWEAEGEWRGREMGGAELPTSHDGNDKEGCGAGGQSAATRSLPF